MQENKKSFKLQKLGTIALLCLLVVAFLGSIFCAMILPFANVNGVASADSIIPSSLPLLAALDSGTSVYGLKVDTSNLVYFVQNTFASLSDEFIAIEFDSVNADGMSMLYLEIINGDSGDFTLFFDYEDSGLNGSVIAGGDGGSSYGLGYILFDSAFIYDEPLDSNALALTEIVYAITTPLISQEEYDTVVNERDELKQMYDTVVNERDELKQMYDSVVNERDEWKQMYDKLVNDMGFSTFNSVDLVSTKPDSISVVGMPILSSRATTATYNNVNYGGYWYYRSNVENAGSNRAYLCEFDIGSTLIANSDIKLTYNAIFPYNLAVPDNVVVVLGLSNFGASSNSSNYKEHIIVIKKEDFINGSIVVNVPFDVNFIAFELCTYDSASGALDKLELSMPNVTQGKYQGIFISNFVVSGRGANFNTVIENANKQGYNKGYQDGKTAGYDLGFHAGVEDNGDYTFMGLLGSVFDAPISAFRGLFDFEILGTNMQGFVLALLTLSVIVVIIKIALGGR